MASMHMTCQDGGNSPSGRGNTQEILHQQPTPSTYVWAKGLLGDALTGCHTGTCSSLTQQQRFTAQSIQQPAPLLITGGDA